MKATVKWNWGLAFTSVANSGAPFLMDSGTSLEGRNEDAHRIELFAKYKWLKHQGARLEGTPD
jgi:hypothetical protein